MKLTDKRFWILLIPIIIMMSCNSNSKEVNTDSDIAIAQAVFSVEKINKEEYIQAESTSADYNIEPQRIDSIAQSEIINRIYQDARERIAAMDSIDRCAIYEAVTDDELFCINNLLYLPDWNLLGIGIPLDYHNNTIWWYDSRNGEIRIGSLFEPTAIGTNGIYVCQVLHDCDIMLDLHFFEMQGNRIYEIQVYKNNNYGGEQCLFVPEEEHLRPIFWHKNNTLYLRSYDFIHNEMAYLKISLN